LYGWTDPVTKREYAIMGRTNGTAFVDITNPRAPRYVAELPKVAGSASTLWREPKVYQNTVYIGVDGTSVGMQVMDLTKLRAYNGTTLQLTANSVYNGVTEIHTLAINPTSGHLYLAGTNVNGGGLRVLNVSNNPLAPTAVGNTTLDGYTHETQVVTYSGPDTQHVGKEIAFNSNGPSGVLSILNVTNKSNITRLSARSYTGERYIHQGWLTEDQKYFFQNDEGDEPGTAPRTRTHLWNVSDLDNPVYRGFFEHQTTAIDHNLYVKDGFVFESNYTTGLRMLKIGNLESTNPNDWLTEVAYYDTYAASDAATFNGAWNNYPYFESGNVPVSDINGGLFIFQPNVSGWDLNPWDPRGGGGGGLPNQSPEPGAATVLIGTAMFGLVRRRAR
jgi:choice-of-anchor B domain-containing protein